MRRALDPAESRLGALVAHLGAIVWEAVPAEAPDGATLTFVSEGTQALLGHPPERWLQEPGFWLESVHADDRAWVRERIATAIARRDGADLEYRIVDASGAPVWVRNIVRVQEDGAAGVRLYGVAVDISGERAADARLRRVREVTDALSGLLDAHEIATVVATRGRQAIGATAAALFLRTAGGALVEPAGYDGAPDAGVSGWEPHAADDARLAALPVTLADRDFGALVLRLAPGSSLGRADRIVLDVLTRACAQALARAETVAAERAANAMLDTVFRSAPEGFALFDREGRYVRVNEALAAINGVPVAEHPGRTLRDVVPDIPTDAHDRFLQTVLETGEPIVDVEIAGYTAADPGRRHTWLVSYYPLHGADGAIDWLGTLVLDITARKRGEERARMLAALGSIADEATGAEQRLERLAAAVAPGLADGCAITLRRGDREQRAAAAGILPAAAADRISLPLVVRGRRLGTLELLSSRPQAFDASDRVLAAELAGRAALAVDNAQLYMRERRARDFTQRQYRVAAALADALTAADVAEAVMREVVGALGAEQATVWQLSGDGATLERIGARGFEPGALAGHERIALRERRPVPDVVRARTPAVFDSTQALAGAYPAFGDGFERAGIGSALIVPLLAAGSAVGGLFVSARRPAAFGDDELALAGALGAQAGQALERARLFEAERSVSVTLQRSLLPAALPRIAGVELAVRYVAAAGLQAGGDFYEALPLPGGDVCIAVGDVVGRGPGAAATMGQLRSALRAFALAGGGPAAVLRQLSAFAETIGGALAATAVVGRLRPSTGELRYACAGHPWPLLAHADGETELLRGGRGVPLACVAAPAYAEASARLLPGSTLLLYTDGLTERRGHDVDDALASLGEAAARAARSPLEELLDAAVSATGGGAPADDVALVAVRLAAEAQPTVS